MKPVDKDLQRTFFGHPRGLASLFFLELWERFSYYGMRALLILFITSAAAGNNPGLALSISEATAIYGLYTFFVYILALPGGWISDRLWGPRRAVFIGGCIIAAGHFTMAIPFVTAFYLGLGLVAVGTGLLKPCASSMVGDLYPEGGARRDAGYSLYYMGINLGAILGPLFCGLLGEGYRWHLGFSLAGFGMAGGLISFRMGHHQLGDIGLMPREYSNSAAYIRLRNQFVQGLAITTGLAVFTALLIYGGILHISLTGLVSYLSYLTVIVTLLFFLYIIFLGGYDGGEIKKILALLWLFILAAVFWSGFEQAGSSINLFAKELTDRHILGIELPASTLQLFNPLFIVIFAPVFGWLWTWLAYRQAHPSIATKFSLGLFGLGAGFFVLSWGAANASAANLVTPAWLMTTFFLHTCGELCLSPIGLSATTKLAPKNRMSQMMGIWFVSAALGNLIAGLLAGKLETLPPSDLFRTIAWFACSAGVIALLASPWIKKLIKDVT